jgi:glycosyltransferase involved in cell wall biosynthesis
VQQDAVHDLGRQDDRYMLDNITPMILTYNEIDNIARTIDKLKWASRILVIDSGSTDGTLEWLKNCSNVEVVFRAFDTFADQCNFGLSLVHTPWVLSLDADYNLSVDLLRELDEISLSEDVAGYQASFVYYVHGRPLRQCLYPPRTVLYRVRSAKYFSEGHGHRVSVTGEVRFLRGAIYHDDRKPLTRWLASQQRYARDEADHLLISRRDELGCADRLRLLAWPAPFVVLLYVLVVRRCILDGWPGWYYALQRMLAELMLALEIIDRRLSTEDGPSDNVGATMS